jgi:hypothetical protein
MVFCQHTDNTLQTLQEGQIHNDQRWEEQRQWNYTTSQTLTSIQEGQDQEAQNMPTLLKFFNLS